jgi:hypothetical protein
MKILKKISEDEVIAEFLKGEINSKRFGKDIINALKKEKKSKNIVINPDLRNKSENKFRNKLLKKEVRKEFFEDFPNNVRWYKAVIHKQELKKAKYINFSYWNKLSSKTRSPVRAAENIKVGVKAFGVSNKGFFEILSEIEKGRKIPIMIFVAKNKQSRLVVLEGHARLTAYFLNEKYIPRNMEIIIGYSGKLVNWNLY